MWTREQEEAWVQQHHNEEGYPVFQPEELSFNIVAGELDEDDPDGLVAIITPTVYRQQMGYCFDQEINCVGLDWDEEMEGIFAPEGDDPRQFLLDLGLTEDPTLSYDED